MVVAPIIGGVAFVLILSGMGVLWLVGAVIFRWDDGEEERDRW